jgi:hypothetical protein
LHVESVSDAYGELSDMRPEKRRSACCELEPSFSC